jgi:hypothetical protein
MITRDAKMLTKGSWISASTTRFFKWPQWTKKDDTTTTTTVCLPPIFHHASLLLLLSPHQDFCLYHHVIAAS